MDTNTQNSSQAGQPAGCAVADGSEWIPVAVRKPTESDMPTMVLEEPTENNQQGRGPRDPLELSVVFHASWFEDDNLEGNGIRYWWPIKHPPLPSPNIRSEP